ncbi:hypothetical protein [Nodosilinea nodulosa]|uniref:hypothetical protein n=1 Tax=Nodosilinea nodulosa TaxID=416001 RepID=UPI0002E88CC6|nr:hypothetical protein [Nodosilinea nodulosa]
MFEYLETEDNGNPEANQGTGSLPLSSGIGGQGKMPRSLPRSINPAKVRHMLYGSLAGIDRTIKILHALGYAEPNDWSEPMPVPSSGVEIWMAILTKTLLLE